MNSLPPMVALELIVVLPPIVVFPLIVADPLTVNPLYNDTLLFQSQERATAWGDVVPKAPPSKP